MNPPCNRNKAYHPQEFDSTVSYECIGTTDCYSFGYYGEQGKKAFQAEQEFRKNHPEIRNVTPVSELHSWLNNSTCSVDACVPLLDDFANKYNCSVDELLNLVQRCIIQSTVETASRLYHVTQTHKLYKQGMFEEADCLVQNPVVPPPVWTTESPSPSQSQSSAPAPIESSKVHHNMLRIKRTAQYNEYVSGLNTDELLLESVCKIDPFTELNVQYLQKLCKRLGIRKYTTMNKDQMVEALTVFKSEYNSCPRFRFECFFKQVTCNGCMDDGTPCKNNKDLMNVGNHRWKYCPDHISNAAISTWDTSVLSDFIESKSNESLSSTTCEALFKNRTFEDIITNPSPIPCQPVYKNTSIKNMKLPFQINDQPLLKLKRTCPKKSKNSNIKTILSKKKQATNKKKYTQRMNDTVSKITSTNSTSNARNKWETVEEETEELEEVEEQTDANHVEDEDENDDDEEVSELEDEYDDEDGENAEDICEDEEEDIDEEDDNESLDVKIAMPRQKRPKLIYHV